MDAGGYGPASAAIMSAGEEAARLWAELPVRVDWAAVAAQCAWAAARARALVVVPAVRALVYLSLAMTVMILVEKLFVCAVCIAVRALRLGPGRRYRWEPIAAAAGDVEAGAAARYPMVLVQIPMYNEREVYKLSIGAACALEWPAERFVIQVLDDSTDPVVKDLVEMECHRWMSKGVNIKYEVRGNRKGYKAGALKEGLKHDYVKDCQYIAMFDADFQPESDFLLRTIPFLVHNPEIALVQARWKFVNSDECLLTRFQEMSLDYHFKYEQEAGSAVYSFFGFNGTAGVWRISAINDAGGWKDRTTVEDMDLAVRAMLRGWKFVYVGDIKVKSELPSTFKAYRFQQHRWSCGPANLFKKMMVEILENKKVSLWSKIHLWYDFFFVGKVAAHTVTFIYYCFAIPVSVLFPEIQIPLWGVVYVPTVITLLKALGTPSSFHLVILWVLFENVMSLHRIKAAVSGLLDAGGRVNEWVVTEKLGDANKTKPSINGSDSIKVIDVNLTELDVKLTEPLIPKIVKRQTRFWERFVNDEGKVMERFLGLQHVQSCTTIALKEALVRMLSSHNLSISMLRGQGYDGASNMRGEFNGVQKLIRDENPYAFYVHCFAHQLQLVVVTVSTSSADIADFFNYVPLIVNNVGASCMRKDALLAKHHDVLLEKIENGELMTGRGLNKESSLARHGDTRWGSHLKTLLRILVMWEAIIDVLEIVKKDSIKPACNGGALGLIGKMESFDFVFILHLMIELLSMTDILSRALQRKDQDIVEAMHLIMDVKDGLQDMRENGWEPLLKKVKTLCERNEIEVPDMDEEINVRETSRRRK